MQPTLTQVPPKRPGSAIATLAPVARGNAASHDSARAAAYREEVVIEIQLATSGLPGSDRPTSSSHEAMRLCWRLVAEPLERVLHFLLDLRARHAFNAVEQIGELFRLAACAVERTSASLPSIALRSRLVTSFMVFRIHWSSRAFTTVPIYQRIAAFLEPHGAFGHQLVEVRGERARGDAMDALGHVVVDQRQHLVERRMLETNQRRHHLALPVEAMRDQAAQPLCGAPIR